MTTCVQSSGSVQTLTPNGANCDIRTTNINLINNYRNYGNDMAITTLPSLNTLSTLNCSDIGIDVNSYGSNCLNQSIQGIRTNSMSSVSSKSVPSIGSTPEYIQIPFGWKRELIDDRVVYYSPTNQCLRTIEELSKYLESDGTCKCGLECPLHISKTFSFESWVISKPYDIEVAKNNNQNQLCNHKRKIIALATYRQHSQQTQQLIAEQQQNQTRIGLTKQQSESEPNESKTINDINVDFKTRQQFQIEDNSCAQISDCLNVCDKTQTNKFSINDSVSVIQSNESFNKTEPSLTQTVLNQISYNCSNLLPQNISRLQQNPNERQTFIGSQFIQQSNCDNRCQYSVPIRADSLREAGNSYCLYDQNGNSGVYSFSTCDSTQISVQSSDNKTSIYLTPQNTQNYGQMISYDNSNVNLIQTSHPQAFTSETYNHYSHPFHTSENVCNSSLSAIPSYIPLGSANANTGAISFSTTPLSTNAITINPTYHSGLHTSQDNPHCHSQNNISILPANPPMPPLSVPNVTTVTTSVTDVIPAVGIAPQIINSTNTSGAPQVLQFINSVPLTQITANTVTVLQQSPSQDVSVPATTLIIPQLMSSHEHPVVINHTMAPQTAVFPHIAAATGLTAISNAFPNTISISNHISLPQRTNVTEMTKPSRTRRRKDYNRSIRSHPPTVASILKQAALKEQELNDKQKTQQKDQELQTSSETNEPNFVANSRTIETECSLDSTQKESISVAVQSENGNDSETQMDCNHELTSFQSDNECSDSPSHSSVPNLQRMSVQNDSNEENPISDSSSEHSSPSNECCNGTGSDSGVESEPTASPSNNCETPPTQQVADSSRLRSLKRLKRLRKELSVYYGNDNSDEESPQSPPLPPQTRTFNIGDLVWGQMGDVRFWPGKLVTDEELVGHSIQRVEGKLIVKWFGDHSLTQVDPESLKTLSEGLEEHHCARKRHRSGKRMNTCLEQAIQEAMMELDRQTSDISSSSSSGVMSTQTMDL